MSTYIWKPSTVASWKGGPVLLVPGSGPKTPPTISVNGQTYTGRYVNTGEHGHQFVFPKELVGMQGLQVNYNGQSSTIESGATSYEGSSLGGWQPRAKGSLGDTSGGGQFTPGQIGDFGFFPAYMGGEFPTPDLATYKNISKAPYKATDVFDFAKKFGEMNRIEVGKNYEQSKNMGLDALNTELKGLQGFAPAAAALQRSLTSQDNIFNQQQRTQQIDQTLPGVRGQLESQGQRAETFAGGKLGSAIEDRAYEVSARSRAADLASSGGFGAESSAARKTSDLMSAEQRLNLSKYGDQLLGQNISTKANLLLAPTEYANAGSQIKVTPTMDAASRANQYLSELNQNTLLSPAQGLTSQIQQDQFDTSLKQRNREFNASNRLQLSMFNSQIMNQFALAKFGYNVGYAGTVAGAAQTNANTMVEIDQANAARDTFNEAKEDTQDNNAIGGIVGAITGIAEIIGNISSSEGASSGSTDSGYTVDTGGQATPPPEPLAPTASDFDFRDTSSSGSSDAGYTVEGGGQASPPPMSTPEYGGATYSGASSPSVSAYQSAPDTISSLGASDSVPQTFNFARMANIQPAEAVSMKSFIQDVGTGGAPRLSLPAVKSMAAVSSGALKMGGISSTPKPGYVPMGYNSAGKPIYSDKALMSESTTTPGTKVVAAIQKTLAPFQNFKREDQENFQKIGALADPEFIGALDSLAKAKDAKAFAKLLSKAVKHVSSRSEKKEQSKKKEKSRKAA